MCVCVCVHATITSEPPKLTLNPKNRLGKMISLLSAMAAMAFFFCCAMASPGNRIAIDNFRAASIPWRLLGQRTLSSTLKWIVPPMVEEGWLVMLISGQWVYNYCQWWQSLQGWRVATVRPYNMAQWAAQILQLSPLRKYGWSIMETQHGTVLLIKCHQARLQHLLFVVAKFS